MTNSGYYSISTRYAAPDVMVIFKEDFRTTDLTSFTLYREGSQTTPAGE